MDISLNEWVYIIIDIFGTYIIYKFMKVFFNVRRTSVRVEILSYTAFYLLITVVYLALNIPFVLMICNFVSLLALTYNYEAAFKKRILSVIFVYLILVCVEITVGLVTGYLDFSLFGQNSYSSIFGLVACRILSFFIVQVLSNYQNIKKGESVPNSNWISIVLIPSASLYITLLLFQTKDLSPIHVMVGVILLLCINFSTFNLYDSIIAAVSDKFNSLLIIEQNKHYNRQLELMSASLQAVKEVKHDLKNHMFSILSLVENGQNEKTLNYVSKILDDIGVRKDSVNSGNNSIDSIINFKLQEAEQRGIRTDLELKIPEGLDIPSFDVTVVLGNLLDNAIKAASEIEKDPYINLTLRYDKGRFLVQIENPFLGDVNEKNGKLLTIKEDKINHGIGLANIRKVIQKYNGSINLDFTDNVFVVSLLMYVDC